MLLEALVQWRKCSVLVLVKLRQNFALVCFTMMMIVICLLMEKKSVSLKQIIKMSTFQLNFA